MPEILAATRNKGKVKEIEKFLREEISGIAVISPNDLNITDDCPETGDTFLKNATDKSLFYSSKAPGILTMADDSGLVVQALNGEPGVYSARYSGENANDEKNIQKLIKEIASKENRAAKFVCVISLSLNGKFIESFTGEVHGVIIDQKTGAGGFGYDPIFFYPPLKKTFAQLTTQEKNKISHRANALTLLKSYLHDNPHLL